VEQDLAKAEHQVTDAERRVARQRELLRELVGSGLPDLARRPWMATMTPTGGHIYRMAKIDNHAWWRVDIMSPPANQRAEPGLDTSALTRFTRGCMRTLDIRLPAGGLAECGLSSS
jgi:hypothetical protein